MTDSDHPTYSNPTIREVVCEIRFQLDDNVNWDSSWYGEFFKRVQAQFPTFHPITVPVFLEFIQAPGGPPGIRVPQIIRYQHISRNLFLQLSENRIAVSLLPSYPGWQQVRDDIRYAWNKLCEVIQPVEITRIGLRYINGIERSEAGETLDKWLKPNEYIPLAVLQSGPGFTAKILVRSDSENRIQVTLADEKSPTSTFGNFLFDIDRITEHTIKADIDTLLDKVEYLHNEIWEVFRSAKSDKLEHLLRGELL